MHIDPSTGRLEGARFVPSPHCDDRPEGTAIELIVVHGISLPPGQFGGPWIDALFSGSLDPSAHPYFCAIASLQVSAHALIRRHGELVQYVPFERRAWHCGVSSWRGRTACNDFSIGIELEGTDDLPYADVQYRRLAELVRALIEVYPALSPDAIAGHSEIAPERKTDPGPAFDWRRLRGCLEAPSGVSEPPVQF